MTTRKTLPEDRILPSALTKVTSHHADVVTEVERTIAGHDVVVVGMAQNPHVKRARRMLAESGIAFEYLEYGSYLSDWQKRLAIKLWSGYPTFPQVFVKGKLVGGANETKAALDDGSLKSMLG